MSVPTDIPDVGSTAQKLAQNPAFDPLRAGLTTEDYFVWSRFDGATTLKDLLLMTGFPVDHSIAIVKRLRTLGAILLPGENPQTLAARARPITQQPTTKMPRIDPSVRETHAHAHARDPDPPTIPRVAARGSQPIASAPERSAPDRSNDRTPAPDRSADKTPPPDRTLDNPTAAEKAALAEDVELSADERALVLAMQRRLRHGDPWQVLGVARGADKKTLKRVYFRLSKELHPDRYYGKRLGSFAQRLNEVFEGIAHAYADLTEDKTDEQRGGPPGADAQAQTPAEYAAELFERACGQEVTGAAAEALKIFDAAIRVDAQPRYLRRAADCALAAKQPRVAEEYAKKAAALDPNDPSTQRILARAFKAAGRLALAEEVILMAMQLKNENDVLAKELRSDLAEIRRLLARSQGF